MQENGEVEINHLRTAVGCGVAVLVSFVLMFLLSKPFEYESGLQRPILAVVGVLLFASAVSFVGLVNAIQVPKSQRKNLLLVVVGLAVSIRMVALFTCPILEIDYYRYLWDGKVLAQNVSPYQFTPAEVRDGLPAKENFTATQSEEAKLRTKTLSDAGLQKLALLSTQTDSNYTILNRIHYGQYTTIYPPVSQLVFGLTMKWFPDAASVEAHIFAIKFVLVLFDLATVAVIFWILCALRFHPGWLVLYAWNPLVIKEVANGGHLDSIATFLLTLSVLAIVKFRLSKSTNSLSVVGGAIALGLGVGAKLSPAVLFPALAVIIARRSSAKALLFSVVCLAVAALSLSPMLSPMFTPTVLDSNTTVKISEQSSLVDSGSETNRASFVPAKVADDTEESQNGLIGFLSKWRMNDPLFSTVYLNLKSQHRNQEDSPWFVVTSRQWREQYCDWLRARSIGGNDPAFFVTRALTLGLFAVFYLCQLLLMIREDDATASGEPGDSDSQEKVANSLSRLAWIMGCFLILQPTINPWYFVWIAPLACFTKNKAWGLVSGILLVYYARFWFKSLVGSYSFFGSNYSGVGLFDHVIVFVEFGLIVLLLVYFRRQRNHDCER